MMSERVINCGMLICVMAELYQARCVLLNNIISQFNLRGYQSNVV